MNKYMPDDLRNLKENKSRVIKNVEAALTKKQPSYKVKKLFVAFSTVAVIAASSLFVINEVKKPDLVVSELIQPLEVGEYDEVLKQYFAKDNTKKTFSGLYDYFGTVFVETKWINEQYVTEFIEKEGQREIKYYRISNNSVQLLKSDPTIENYSVEELNELPIAETILKYDGKNFVSTDEWEYALDFSAYDDFREIILMKKKLNDNETYTKAFVKNVGLIYETHKINNTADDMEIFTSSLIKYQNNVWDEKRNFYKIDNAPVIINREASWLISPDESLEIVNQGLGDFEGTSKLLMRNTANPTEITYFYLNSEQDQQETVKEIQWLTNKHVLLTIGQAYGTITQGGQLFILDIVTSELTPILVDPSGLGEFTSIKKDGNEIQLEKFVYHSNEYNYEDAHIEQDTLTIIEGNIVKVENERINIQMQDGKEQTFDIAYNLTIEENVSGEIILVKYNDYIIHIMQ